MLRNKIYFQIFNLYNSKYIRYVLPPWKLNLKFVSIIIVIIIINYCSIIVIENYSFVSKKKSNKIFLNHGLFVLNIPENCFLYLETNADPKIF